MSILLWLFLSCAAHTHSKLPDSHKKIFDDISWTLRLKLWKEYLDKTTENPRKVGMERLQLRRMQVEDVHETTRPHEDGNNDDNNMRLKLFRLMYETVRDSDLKVKRAELIRYHYNTSKEFEIGYVMGDITDKYNIMTDISLTLDRLYKEWKPIEHINAYEQIANQAIQISHLIDLIRSVNKRNVTRF